MNRPAQQGFTLLEIMLVITIIAIFSSMVIINVRSDNEKIIRDETTRLMHTMQLAIRESRMAGIDIGLSLDKNEYQFLEFDDTTFEWIPLNEKHFKLHVIDSSVNVNLVVDGLIVDLIKDFSSEDDEASEEVERSDTVDYGEAQLWMPSIMFLSDGTITPFQMTLDIEDSERWYVLQTRGIYEIELEALE